MASPGMMKSKRMAGTGKKRPTKFPQKEKPWVEQ
jgi:hypothetical protein